MKDRFEERVPWTDCLIPSRSFSREGPHVIGVLTGEGIGNEVIGCAVEILKVISRETDCEFDIRYGSVIGRDAEKECGEPLSAQVIRFCDEIFRQDGAVLCGPGGGRFVYDMRKQFDLFFKISPLQVENGFSESSRLNASALRDVDILVTREGRSGVYQGDWGERADSQQSREASQEIIYREHEVQRFLDASAKLAQSRSGNLTVVWKESGVPTISALWRDCAEKAAADKGIRYQMIDVDLMAYRLIQDAPMFDVIATPNLCGDVLADLGAVLLGSRGVSYSGNFSACGRAVYQTNHGAAYDLAGKGTANPVGQILSMAMMLRETYGLGLAAQSIERAVQTVRDEGYVTADLGRKEAKVVGTEEMASRIADHVPEFVNCPTNC